MAEPAMRVALLARPGAACDNLQAALRQAGADVVLVADPTGSDAGIVAASKPRALLVALEPSVEDALDGYQDLLQDPRIIVIYDEVAVAARREGWDAARWVRHLAAKLRGDLDVLPPGADAAPEAPAATVRAVAPEPEPAIEPAPEAPVDDVLRIDDFDDIHLGVDEDESGRLSQAGSEIDFGGLTDEMMAALAVDLDEALAPPSTPPMQSEPATASESEHVLEWEPQSLPPVPPASPSPAPPSPASPPPPPPPQPAAPPAVPDTVAAAAPIAHDVPAIKPSPSRFSLSMETPAEQGAVVVLAGIGGPDAVRQFLGALPMGFARPVVVRQRLDGGRHDRLVRQMQRATALPVELAEAGARLVAAHVYILPDGMTTLHEDGSTVFVATDAPVPVLAGLPAADSAILVLSGSDPAVVGEVATAAGEGALVAAQSADECFDSAAPAALIAAGGDSGTPAGLALRLSTRWLSLKD